jgi:hypothetical protein
MEKVAMTFRVGLLFYSSPVKPFRVEPISELLQKLSAKSIEVRKDSPLTLAPFVRTGEMADFSKSVADKGGFPVESFAFDKGGVACAPLEMFDPLQQVKYDGLSDFNLGMKVLLSRCDVIAIICRDVSDFPQVHALLAGFHNTSVLVALVAPRSFDDIRFVEIDPLPTARDYPTWQLAVSERWEAIAAATPNPIPKRKKTILGLIFPLFNTAIIRRRAETLKVLKKKLTESEQCESDLGLSPEAKKKLTPADNNSLQTILSHICPHFVAHDDLGRHYSNVFRTTCLLVPSLTLVSTILAVAASIDVARHNLWHICEGLFLIIAAAIFFRSRIAQHHRKWVEHRLLAELLRPTMLSTLFQIVPPLTPPSEEPRLWIDRSRILLRHLRALPTTVFDSDKESLRSARISAINEFSSRQAKWHKNFANQHRTAEARLSRMSAYAFVFTLSLCVLQIVFALLINLLASHTEGTASHGAAMGGVGHVLLMGTLISASSACVLLILSHQLGFEAIAERSSNASEHFEKLQNEIAVSGHEADARRVYAWADKCAGDILAEQHSWYRQIPLIRMHL